MLCQMLMVNNLSLRLHAKSNGKIKLFTKFLFGKKEMEEHLDPNTSTCMVETEKVDCNKCVRRHMQWNENIGKSDNCNEQLNYRKTLGAGAEISLRTAKAFIYQ